MNRALALATIIPLVAGCAESANPPVSVQSAVPPQARVECVDFRERIKAWAVRGAGQLQFTVYDGRRAENAIKFFNSLPPPSRFHGDVLAVGILGDAPRSLILIGREGCVIAEAFVSRELAVEVQASADSQGV